MKKITSIFLYLLAVHAGNHCFSQPGFQRLYGGVNQEISFVALQSPTGGFYFLGATTSAGNGDADPALLKLDDDGQIVWARTIGAALYDVAGAMTIATDGGLVCAGSTKSFNGNTPDDLYFFKTDTLGNLVWSKTFSTPDFDVASAILRTADGGYALTGFSRIGGLRRVLLIRTDVNGDTLFVRIYGGTGDDQGVELFETADGGFLITGKTFTQTLGESDILLMRTDAQGNLLWAKSFGDTLWDEGAGIIQLQDGNYLISGSTISFGQGDFDILILKTDTSGNILWGKTYGGLETDASYTARENPDGSIVLSGYTSSLGYGHNYRGDDSTNIFLLKVDADGDTLWTRTYGDGAQDEAFHFSRLSDGGYLIPSFSSSYTNTTDSTQMMLIRTDSLGHSGCHEQDAHPMIDTTAFITQTLTFTQTGGLTETSVISNSLAWNVLAEDACLYIQVGELRKMEIEVFPNPAGDRLTVTCRDQAIQGIEICNFLGERVLIAQATGFESQVEVNTSDLSSGIYFLKLETSAYQVTKKIIIQKN